MGQYWDQFNFYTTSKKCYCKSRKKLSQYADDSNLKVSGKTKNEIKKNYTF